MLSFTLFSFSVNYTHLHKEIQYILWNLRAGLINKKNYKGKASDKSIFNAILLLPWLPEDSSFGCL